MNVNVISTSPREGSNSLKVAKAIAARVSAVGQEPVLTDFLGYDLPFVGQGTLDKDNLSPFADRLAGHWSAADLVIMVVPEYNWFTSGQLINAIHMLGSDAFGEALFHQKVFALAGVSAGRGGRLPTIEMTMLLNKMISFMDYVSIVSPKVMECHETQKNYAEDGAITGPEFIAEGLNGFVDYSVKVAQQWHSGISA